MIRNTQAFWPALGAVLLGATLAGCGGNNGGDNTAATTTDTTTSAPSTTTDTTTNTASTDTGSTSTGTASTGSTTPAAGSGGVSVSGKASTASFTGAAATWKQVTAANAALDKVIKSKKLSEVHEAAFKVRDIVKTLPAKSGALPADKQKTLASQVKNVAQLASLLDEAGDSGKLKETQENQAGMNDALDIIKGLYPAGALG